MNICFELIPIIITVFLILMGNKIKEYLLNSSIENKLEEKVKNVDAPMQVICSILLLTIIFADEAYILTRSSNIKEIISSDIHKVWEAVLAVDKYSTWRGDLSKTEIIKSLIVTLISVLNIFWWNENCYF